MDCGAEYVVFAVFRSTDRAPCFLYVQGRRVVDDTSTRAVNLRKKKTFKSSEVQIGWFRTSDTTYVYMRALRPPADKETNGYKAIRNSWCQELRQANVRPSGMRWGKLGNECAALQRVMSGMQIRVAAVSLVTSLHHCSAFEEALLCRAACSVLRTQRSRRISMP